VDREVEIRTGCRIDAALGRIQSQVSLMGMAGKWHLGKASDVLKNPSLLERDVDLRGGPPEADYLEQLPSLIAQAAAQDGRCAECWNTVARPDGEDQYALERDQLVRLFQRFRIRPKLYERLVRQPDKPILRRALRLLSEGKERTAEATAVERAVRMRLQDYVRLEEGFAPEIRDLDEARYELFAAHQALAFDMARSQMESDESTISSALDGLRRAAAWYDYKRGFNFEQYAQHWIQAAIDKRRAST
jgi:hypothetical protein